MVRLNAVLLNFFFVFALEAQLSAQDKAFNSFPDLEVIPKVRAYDGSIVYSVQSMKVFGTPYYVVKQGLEGKEVWRIRLKNILAITGISQTNDSGLVVAGILNRSPQTDPNDPNIPQEMADTIYKAFILKFDKNVNLQWAKYVSSPFQTFSSNTVEDKSSNLYFYVLGINLQDFNHLPVTILKLNKKGELLKKASYEGIGWSVYTDLLTITPSNKLCLLQNNYVPLTDGGKLVYVFGGLKMLDTALNTLAKTIPGYKTQYFNQDGCIGITDRIHYFGNFRANITQDSMCPLIGNYDLNTLEQQGALRFDMNPSPGFTNAVDAVMIGDSIYTLDAFGSDYQNADRTFIRLYDNQNNRLINKAIYPVSNSTPTSLLVDNQAHLVAGTTIHNLSPYPDISHVYYLDRNLNPIPWPTTAPTKGYDWARTATIPDSQVIDVNAVAVPLKIEIDDTPPDWTWLWTSIKDQNVEEFSASPGWVSWPQPAGSGEAIHLKATNNPTLRMAGLTISFYDLQGKESAKVQANPVDNEEWVIHPPQFMPGLYMALIGSKAGQIIGKIKIEVR